MKKDAFSSFHPSVNLLYFVLVIGFAVFFMHPIPLGLSLGAAILYALSLRGKRVWQMGLKFLLPMLVITAVLNPLLNHRGATILAYLPNGNPLTLESSLYGLAAAVMLLALITWFSCVNQVMCSEKIVYLFGRVAPALSLILAMALRLVPRLRGQLRHIANAQKGLGRNMKKGSLRQRTRWGLQMLSILVTWALENAIETADSMRARGYGLGGRTAYSIFTLDRRDMFALAYLLFFGFMVIAGAWSGAYEFHYFPWIYGRLSGLFLALTSFAHLALLMFPMIVNKKEDLLWKAIESKI